jgi:CHAT domain-containing protein
MRMASNVRNIILLIHLVLASLSPFTQIGEASEFDAKELERDISKAQYLYYFEGNTKEATSILEGILTKYKPKKYDLLVVRHTLMSVYAKTENLVELDRSVKELNLIIKESGNYFVAVIIHDYFLARLLSKLGKVDEAIVVLKNLLKFAKYPTEHAWELDLQSRMFLGILYSWKGDYLNAEKYIKRAIIAAASINALTPSFSISLLMEYCDYLTNSGRAGQALRIMKKVAPGVKKEFANSLDKVNWDLVSAYAYLENGKPISTQRKIAEINSYITPQTQTPVLQRLRMILYEGVSGHLIGESATIDAMMVKADKIKPSESYLGYRKLINFVGYTLGNNHKIDIKNFEGLPTNQLEYLLSIIYKIHQADTNFTSNNHRQAIANLAEALNAVLKTFKSRSSNPHINNTTFLWSERFLVEEILSRIGKANKNTTANAPVAGLVFEAIQYLNHTHDNTGAINRLFEGEMFLDIEKLEVKSYQDILNNQQGLLTKATGKLIDIALSENKTGEKFNVDTRLVMQYQGYEYVLEDLINSKGIIKNLLSEKSSFPEIDSFNKLLDKDEAVVIPTFLKGQLVVGCKNESSFYYKSTDLTKAEVLWSIEKLLSSLNPKSSIEKTSFPLKEAFLLYENIFNVSRECLAGKKHVNIIPHPDLLPLPYNVLITQNPDELPGDIKFADFPWIIKKKSLALSPSLKTFQMLRTNLNRLTAKNDFIGFGNPLIGKKKSRNITIAKNDLFLRGIENDAVFADLPSLPATETELINIQSLFSKKRSKIFVKEEATEGILRRSNLENYKVVSFATHGLMAGEYDQVSEPSLILTPGNIEYSSDDGILTSGEIRQLNINANLVILSACNTTASSGKPDGTSFSGLIDAFFLSGVRSVAATQWTVYSKAAQELASNMIKASIDENIGVSASLRKSMLRFISNPPDGLSAHPKYWGAFVVAGNGKQLIMEEHLPRTSGFEIKVDWRNTVKGKFDEGITAFPDNEGNRFFTSGYTKSKSPFPDKAVTYLRIIDDMGELNESRLYEKFAGSLRPAKGINNDYVFSGQTHDKKNYLGVEYLLLDRDLNIESKFKVDTKLFDISYGMINDGKHYYSLVSHHDWVYPENEDPDPMSFTIHKLDSNLKQVSSNTFKIKDVDGKYIDPVSASFSSMVFRGGKLWFFINYDKYSSEGNQENKLFNEKKQCGTKYYSSQVSIDAESLIAQKVEDHKSIKIPKLKIKDGKIFALAHKIHSCLTRNIALFNVDSSGKMKPVFEYQSPFIQFASDMAFFEDRILVVGFTSIRTKIEYQGAYPTDDPFKEFEKSVSNTGKVNNGWAILLNNDGKLLDDYLLIDNSSSLFTGVGVNRQGRGVLTGSSNGMQVLEMGVTF